MKLPVAPKKLVGREIDIQIIQKALSNHQVFFIDGQGGIGKTTLVSKIIYDLRKKESLKIYYFHVTHNNSLEVFLDVTLSQIFSELKIESQLKSSLNDVTDRLYLLVELCNDHPGILCIDNVHHLPVTEQKQLVEYLSLYLFDCITFFISRETRPSFDSHIPIPFDYTVKPLPKNAVTDFLEMHHAIKENSDAIIEDIFRLSQGNPLLLQQAVSHLRREHHQEDFAISHSLISAVTQSLPETTHHLLVSLCFYSHPLPELVFLELGEKKNIELLLQHYLIIKDPENHYLVYDPVKDYIFSQLSPQEKQKYAEICLKSLSSRLDNTLLSHWELSQFIHNIKSLLPFSLPSFEWEKTLNTLLKIMSENDFGVSIIEVATKYFHLFGFKQDIFCMICLTLLDDEQINQVINFYAHFKTHIDSIVTQSHNDDLIYIQLIVHYCLKKESKIQAKIGSDILPIIKRIFEKKKTQDALNRMLFLGTMIDFYPNLSFHREFRMLVEQVFLAYTRKEITPSTVFEKIVFVFLTLGYLGTEHTNALEYTISGKDMDLLTTTKQKTSACKILWYYYARFDQPNESGKMIDKFLSLKIFPFLSLNQQIYIMYARCFTTYEQGKFHQALNLLEEFHQVAFTRQGHDNLAMYLKIVINTYNGIGWFSKAEENIHTLLSIPNSGSNIQIIVLRSLARSRAERGLFKESIDAIRQCFRQQKVLSLRLKNVEILMIYYMLARVLVRYKPVKGILKLLNRVYNYTSLREYSMIMARLVEAEYYMMVRDLNRAQILIENILQKTSALSFSFLEYQCLELYADLLFLECQYEKIPQVLSKLDKLWESFGNSNIPSKLQLYRAALAYTMQFHDLAFEELLQGYKKAKVFGHEGFIPLYLSAIYLLAHGATTNNSVFQPHILEYQKILLEASSEYKNYLSTYMNGLFSHKDDTSQTTASLRLQQIIQPSQTISHKIKLYINKDSRIIRSGYNKTLISFGGKKKLFDIFCLLLDTHPKSITIEQCFTAIWKYKYSPSLHANNIHVAMKRLRAILKIIPMGEHILITTTDGYRLNDEIEYIQIRKEEIYNLNERQTDIIKQIGLHFSKKYYIQRYNVSAKTAYTDLRQLIEMGQIIRVFENSENKYMVKA